MVTHPMLLRHQCDYCGRFMTYRDCATCSLFSLDFQEFGKCRHRSTLCPQEEKMVGTFKLMRALFGGEWQRIGELYMHTFKAQGRIRDINL